MFRVKLFVLAAACLLSVCQSATVPEGSGDSGELGESEEIPESEELVELTTQRFGSFNQYYIMTWQNIVSGTDMELVPNTAAAIEALTFDGTENVAIVVHGRGGSVNSEFGFTLRSSLITADRNMVVILVDWAFIASLPYTQAALLVPSVAADLSSFIAQMDAANKLNRNLLNLIGFDLGAHIVGIASRTTASRARKITALSPAGQGWDRFSSRLRSTDAQFVEVIHTDVVGVRALGIIGETIGGMALEFFPNGGTRQPGCAAADNDCHHNRAWQLFAATVDTGGHLMGMRCDSMTQVNNNRCTGLPVAVMGTTEMIKLPTGLYRVNTGNSHPYNA